MWGAFGAPHSDTRSPCFDNKFRWRRDRLEAVYHAPMRVVSAVEHEG